MIVDLYERFWELFWYGVFGVLTTIINLVAFAWVIAFAFAYVTNKLWVFESKGWERAVWIPECIGFVSTRLATGLLDMGPGSIKGVP